MQRKERKVSDFLKRQVLVVDDEQINRDMLGYILSQDYGVLYASNGKEALEQLDRNPQISAVLLDLMMPVMDGFEVLKARQQDDDLKKIPFIVLTSEKDAEVESLRNGANDFIPKPYDMPEVIRARVEKTIDLSENTALIRTVEHDELTKLFRREFFYQYCDKIDKYNQGDMDAVLMDISHFHLVNEMYGKSFGDDLLKRVAEHVQAFVAPRRGIASRSESDKFLMYLPTGSDYEPLLEEIHESVNSMREGALNVRMRLGVYEKVDKTIEPERRFDRAKVACDMVRDNYNQFIGRYDKSMHEYELYNEQLVSDMESALRNREFIVYYQPKFNIQGEKPSLRSAEALIRWKHSRHGLISPGIFVPLFEKNGMIQKLDRFVWEEAAAQIRRWKEKYGVTVPISVNVSRVDIYDPELVDRFVKLMQSNDLDPADYHLEITESAYTENSDQIVHIVDELRTLGFHVEMDDFGSGYSSLNMLTELPIDALKLDMKFINGMQEDDRKRHMVELMIDIANYLGVPVIAEGVEKEEQMRILKQIGCSAVQGYYFSPPIPAEKFEELIEEHKEDLC